MSHNVQGGHECSMGKVKLDPQSREQRPICVQEAMGVNEVLEDVF